MQEVRPEGPDRECAAWIGRRTPPFGKGYCGFKGRNAPLPARIPCYKGLQIPLPGRMKLVSIPANPVPDGATVGTVKTSDGALLRFARFDPPAGRKGTLVVLQGRAEFIEKYFEVVHDARKRGFAVAMVDWRGQGLSERALSNAR